MTEQLHFTYGCQGLEGGRQDRELVFNKAFLSAQMVKTLPPKQETWVQSLGWEDPLEEGMTTHFSILAWRNPWTEEPSGL